MCAEIYFGNKGLNIYIYFFFNIIYVFGQAARGSSVIEYLLGAVGHQINPSRWTHCAI